MPYLPLAQIEQTAGRSPENLIFFSSGSLFVAAADAAGRFSEDCRLEVLAELIVRWYLNPAAELEKTLDSVFPEKEWHALKKIKEREFFTPCPAAGLPRKLWESADLFSQRCEQAARRRLTGLLNADGFIPVYSGSEAFFLPFFFEEDDRLPLIGDAAGVPVANWLEPYSALFGDEPRFRCVVCCRQSDRLPPFAGHSLMLPLFLAYKRKTGGLPPYNRFRLLSTGAIEHGRLKPVATEEKRNALGRCFRDAFLFFPENSPVHSEERNSVPLNIASGLEEILQEIRKQIEAKGLVIPTFRDARKRLERLEYETRHTNQDRWEIMIARLQNNMDAIRLSRDRDPEAFLLCLMLKSAMYCHGGNTAQAMAFNRQARDEAQRLHLEKPLRRLEIEELVELQDVEDFESIRTLADILKEDIERLRDDDLLMRFYGTMGQAHCYAFLAGIPGFERQTADSYFRRALSYAQHLDSEQDIAQDLNYCFLWSVLFEPASDNAQTAYSRAYDHIERNLMAYPESQKKNRFFLQRLRMQQFYRLLLLGQSFPSVDFQSEDLPEEAVPWLRALVKKYLGAAAAFRGENKLAGQFFSKADSLLEGETDDNVIAFIRMTVLAEAWRSLADENYREQALKALESLQNQYPRQTEKWRNFLLGKAPFPGLDYWY